MRDHLNIEYFRNKFFLQSIQSGLVDKKYIMLFKLWFNYISTNITVFFLHFNNGFVKLFKQLFNIKLKLFFRLLFQVQKGS